MQRDFGACKSGVVLLASWRACVGKGYQIDTLIKSGSEKGVFWKRGLFRKVLVLEILENLESRVFGEPQTAENKADSHHFLENVEILERLETSPVERPLP